MCKTSNFEKNGDRAVTSRFYFGFYRKFRYAFVGIVSKSKCLVLLHIVKLVTGF